MMSVGLVYVRRVIVPRRLLTLLLDDIDQVGQVVIATPANVASAQSKRY